MLHTILGLLDSKQTKYRINISGAMSCQCMDQHQIEIHIYCTVHIYYRSLTRITEELLKVVIINCFINTLMITTLQKPKSYLKTLCKQV